MEGQKSSRRPLSAPAPHSHCEVCRFNHQHAGFPCCGKIDRLQVIGIVPIRSYSTLFPFSGVARNWFTCTTSNAVPRDTRIRSTAQSPRYSTPNRIANVAARRTSLPIHLPISTSIARGPRSPAARCRRGTSPDGPDPHRSRCRHPAQFQPGPPPHPLGVVPTSTVKGLTVAAHQPITLFIGSLIIPTHLHFRFSLNWLVLRQFQVQFPKFAPLTGASDYSSQHPTIRYR